MSRMKERYLFVQEQLQKPGPRRVIKRAAERKARAARALVAAEGLDVPVLTSEGTRPRGRPYARVSVPASAEFGDSKTRRLRLLARVVNT